MADLAGDRALEDLTARARIRDAALRLFAERGIAGATIRDIAKAAGVSSGLVRHHFGSKEALRDSCDTYALDRLMSIAEDEMSRIDEPVVGITTHPTVMLLQQYLARSASDGSEAAYAMFERTVNLIEEWMARDGVESADRRAFAAVLAGMGSGLFLRLDQVSRVLGVDVRTPEGYLRLNSGLLDLYSTTLISREQVARFMAALARRLPQPPLTDATLDRLHRPQVITQQRPGLAPGARHDHTLHAHRTSRFRDG